MLWERMFVRMKNISWTASTIFHRKFAFYVSINILNILIILKSDLINRRTLINIFVQRVKKSDHCAVC